MAGLTTSIRSNQAKTTLLVVLFPVLLLGVVFGVAYGISLNQGYGSESIAQAIFLSRTALQWLIPIVFGRGVIAFLFHRQLIFSFSGAKPLNRQENPMVYNIVENLCISRGLPMPRIWILDDSSMNAFAVGRHPKHAWIVFSRGVLEKLTKDEIEAVAGHELTHIINRDSLLMIIIVVFIGIVSMLGELLVRTRSSSNDRKWGSIFVVAGLWFLVLGYLFYPLIRLAISRRREFLADAWSVELTKNPQAMISALQKISADPTIESIEKDTVAAMCIINPFGQSVSRFRHLLLTHPPIEERIKALQAR